MTKKQEDLFKIYLQVIKERKPLTINYGVGIYGKEVKDYAVWDGEVGRYRDSTGTWNIDLLLQIARGEVEGTTLCITEK